MKFKPDNINQQGRPKVYFCCHTNDFDNYFEVVSNEVLEKQKCTIWYAENEDERNDEYLSNLKEMQLFVMPVTTNLLCTENEALGVEFKFAIENHIPVLPLMQEAGLEELFNQKCGDLQFLDKQNTDITAISYNDKLDKYLSSVLIGDELAEKIRAAFDAYIFLSYRKKDRKYAQELMHLIHKNDFCRDIAIWYDEFLTPGENFNDSIIQAIQKSGLFVLTVTPNLVNEKNYVMTEEYPLAQKEGKVIFPAEMVETNKSDLFSKFKNMPECVNARNEDEFTDALLKIIKQIAIKENKKTPEHNFFIGLAYLNGIDVEKDIEKALRLIEGSANTGLLEAFDQLVTVFRVGQGVSIDYNKTIYYLNKKISFLKNECKNKNRDELIDVIFWELLTLCDYYREISDIECAKKTLVDANAYIDNKANLIKRNRKEAAFYERVAELCKTEGLFEKAKKCLEVYINKLVEICDEEPTDDRINDVLVAYCKLGDLLIKEGKLDDAIKHYNAILEAEEQLNFFENSDDFRKKIHSSVLSTISYIVSKEKKDTITAKNLIEKALIIDNTIDDRSLEAQRDISVHYVRMGEICSVDNSEKALEWYDKARRIMENVAQKSQNQMYINDVALIYGKMVDIYNEKEEYAEALKIAEKSVNLIRDTYEKSSSLVAKEKLAHSVAKLGNVLLLLAVKDNEAMENNDGIYFEKRTNDDGSERTDLVFDIRSGHMKAFFKRKKHFETAEKCYIEAQNLYEELKDQLKTYESKRDLKVCYNNISSLYDFVGDIKEAQIYSVMALELANEIALETTSNIDMESLAEAFYNYAQISQDVESYKSAYEIWNFLCDECPDIEEYKENKNKVLNVLENFI